ncbi:hypothetical protein OROHE_008135 [Orobanche hederae]
MPLSKHQTVLLCGTLSREHHFRSYCCLHTRNMATTLLSTSGLKKSYQKLTYPRHHAFSVVMFMHTNDP